MEIALYYAPNTCALAPYITLTEVAERLGKAHRSDKHPEGLQRRLGPAHETIDVPGGESFGQAILIGTVG